MNKKIFIFFILTLVIFPVNVMAFTGNIGIDCEPSFATSGKDIKCTITGNSDTEIIDVSAKIELTSNLVYQSFELDPIWEGSDFDTGKIDIYTESGEPVKDTFNIGILNLKVKDGAVNSNETVKLIDVEYTYTYNEYSVGGVAFNVRVPSNINTLDTLAVDGATIDFNKDTINYAVEVNADKTIISATKTDDKATLTGDGEKTLKYGGNTFVITVTAEDGSKKEYTLNITRPDGRSSENNLTDLDFYNYNLSFNQNTTVYNLSVENNISKIAICTEENDSSLMLCINKNTIKVSDKASYSVYLDGNLLDMNGTTLPLVAGNNELKIIVTAENDGKKTYTFNINRKTIDIGVTGDGNDDIDEEERGDEITKNPDTSDIPIFLVLILVSGLGIYIFKFDFGKNMES